MMARPLLNASVMRWMLASGAAATSCVIPPNLELDEVDGGTGSPPVIISSGPSPEFSVPGPLVLERNDSRDITLTVEDLDIDDDLYVRMFVNYPVDTAVRAECQVGPTGSTTRVIECPTARLCEGVDDQDTSRHFLEAMVADRAFLADNNPEARLQEPNRALPGEAGYSFRAWMISCTPAD
jgi:hypothetical protein